MPGGGVLDEESGADFAVSGGVGPEGDSLLFSGDAERL